MMIVYEEEQDEDYKDVVCENCHETIYIESSIFNNREELLCPNCDAVIKK